MAFITSNTQPPNGALGDEWYNPVENVIYKMIPRNGTTPEWHGFGNTAANAVITTTYTQTNTTITSNLIYGQAGDVYWNSVSLLLDAGNTSPVLTFDTSTNKLYLEPVGDTKPASFNPYQGDGYYSNYFDGTGDYLTVPDNTALDAFGDFTIEFWVFFNTVTGTQILVDKGWNNSAFAPYAIFTSGTSLLFHASSTGSSFNVALSQSIGTIATGQWYHVAVARSGSSIRLFLNGSITTTLTNNSTLMNGTSALGIGAGPAGAIFLNGYISNLRIVKGTAVYTSAFTPPTTPLTAITNTVLLTCQSNRFIDKSTNNFTLTKAGDTTVSPAIPFTANSSYSTYGSAYLDGTGDYLSLLSAIVPATGNFTIEFWIYSLTNAGSAQRAVYAQYSGGTSGRFMFGVDQTSASRIWLHYNGTDYVGTTNGILPNTWTHLALVRNGDVFNMFVNGELNATNTFTGASLQQIAGSIGGVGGSFNVNAQVSNLRIVVGTAVYTTTFTPPTTPLTAIANTQLLTLQYNGSFDTKNAAIIDEGMFQSQFVKSGNVPLGSFSPNTPNVLGISHAANVNGGSAYFDGSGDYMRDLSGMSNAAYTFTDNFTAEAWVYPKSLSGTYSLFCLGSENPGRYLASIINGQIVSSKQGNAATYYVGANVIGNTWSHVAFVRQSNTIKLYLNGTASVTSNVFPGVIGNGGFTLAGDSSASSPFYGYISGVRLAKRSLYGSDFTSNTAAISRNDTRFYTGLNNSVLFNGSSQYLTAPASTAWNFTGDWTWECWVYPTSITGFHTFLSQWGGDSSLVFIWKMNSSGRMYLENSTTNYTATSTTIVANQWQHIALTRSGSTIRMFVNGVLDSNSPTSSGTYYGAGVMRIGVLNGPVEYFAGYISNMRVINGTALYTTTFTPSTTPLTAITNTQLLTFQSDTIIDNSINNFTLTSVGSPTVSTLAPSLLTTLNSLDVNLLLNFSSGGVKDYRGKDNFETFSVGLNGNIIPKFNIPIGPFVKAGTTQITVPHDPRYDFTEDTVPFTVEYWIYPTQFAGLNVNAYVIQKGALSGTTYPQWASKLTTDGNVRFNIGNATGASVEQSLSGNIRLTGNAWNHVAHTRNIANVLTTWVNGNIAANTLQNVTIVSDNGRSLIIGNETNGSGTGFDGYLENIRITNGVCRYTAPFTPDRANTFQGYPVVVSSTTTTTSCVTIIAPPIV